MDEPPSLTATIEPLDPGLHPGVLVAGKYRILGEIGRGGMGVVYEADDVHLRRPVALKFLPAELTHDPESRARFVHEAQAASGLDNPHICTIYDIGESDDRRMFIAMAICRGESLRTRIRRAGPLAPAEALALALQVADGLAAAHANGIVHRDVKPANVLVSPDGTARVADFGLAKIAGEARLTRAGHAVGTVAYMSPEQLRGEDVDARSDVWSLGVVLYEMLTGALPFHGTTEHSLAYDIVNGAPKSLTALPDGTPPGCVGILEKALAKDPAARYASAVEMADAIADVRESAGYSGRALAATRRAAAGPFAPAARRRRALVRGALFALGGAAAFYAIIAFRVPARVASLLGLSRPASFSGLGITVFPPSVLGDDPADRALGDGLAEYLRRRLDEIARASHAWITPGDHLHDYGVREAADARSVLGSSLAVSGTLRRAGDNVTLTLDVTDLARLRRLASVPVTDHIANIATWQDDLVRKTATALGLALPASLPPTASPLDFARTTVPSAFEAYLRGLGAWSALPASLDTLSAAVASFEEAVRLDPSFAAASADLVSALRDMSVEAKDRAVLARAETVARSLLATDNAFPRAHFALAAVLRSLGRPDDAIAELERAVALDPLYYDAFVRLGSLYEDGRRPAQAEAAYRSALAARPGYWAACSYLGLLFFFQGDYDKARDAFEPASRACPSNIALLNYLGAIQFKLGAFDPAIRTFERSNQIRRSGDVLSNLAVLYYYSGRYADSVNAGESAVAFPEGETSNQIWGNLADAYRFTPGNDAKAAAAYAKAIELTEPLLAANPSDVRSRARLAVYLAKAGRTAPALEMIDTVLKGRPVDADIVLHAIVVYELAGERPRALEAVREYVGLNGSLDEIVRDPFLAGLRRDSGYLGIVEKKPGGPSGAPSD